MIKDILSKAQLKDQLLASVVAEAEAEAETTCNADVNKTPEGDDTRLEETISKSTHAIAKVSAYHIAFKSRTRSSRTMSKSSLTSLPNPQ